MVITCYAQDIAPDGDCPRIVHRSALNTHDVSSGSPGRRQIADEIAFADRVPTGWTSPGTKPHACYHTAPMASINTPAYPPQ